MHTTRNPLTTNYQTNKQTKSSFVWAQLTQQLSHSNRGRDLSVTRSCFHNLNGIRSKLCESSIDGGDVCC